MKQESIYLLRVLIGGLLGLTLGVERQRRQKEAGIAPHFIVGCASALLTCVSLWFAALGDGARIAAQIVSGIGFLGAGVIFFRRESTRGLTTAAGIWATAAIGICTGTGMYLLAVGTTLLILLFQVAAYSRTLTRHARHLLSVKMEYNDGLKVKLLDYFGCHNFHRFKIAAGNDGRLVAEAVIYPTANCAADEIARFMTENPEVLSVERLEDL